MEEWAVSQFAEDRGGLAAATAKNSNRLERQLFGKIGIEIDRQDSRGSAQPERQRYIECATGPDLQKAPALDPIPQFLRPVHHLRRGPQPFRGIVSFGLQAPHAPLHAVVN